MTDTDDIPDFRARVLAEVVKAIMTVPGAVSACTVCSVAREALRLPEEECSLEIFAAIFLLVRFGLVLSRTGSDTSCRISAETELTASKALVQFTWAEPVLEGEDA